MKIKLQYWKVALNIKLTVAKGINLLKIHQALHFDLFFLILNEFLLVASFIVRNLDISVVH